GDFGELKTPCPKCGGLVKETYKKFQCSNTACDFALWKIVAGRQLEPFEVEELISKKQVGPLQGFRSKMGKPFAAIIKMSAEGKAEFDFGNNDTENGEPAAVVDFSAQEPIGKCPKCAANVFEHGMNYICEKATGPAKTCDFRTGKIILQQPIEKTEIAKLLSTGKTNLLAKFISKKGRPFKAFLVLDPKTGKVGFEFEKREPKAGGAKGKRTPKEPEPKIDFTGLTSIGKCPLCSGAVFETPTHYVCEKSQADSKPCKLKIGKVILQQPVELDQLKKLLTTRKTDLLTQFVSSKSGRSFSAHLVLEQGGKVGFEFAERDA
ncbi:MAG TPA: topoisomerase C-terminal repeat-containing protein, partial [Roseimicrobium sp.]|nr:topoisomerase C-terminal repeat-containing protein [Roseimicrobium sp.]